MGDKRLKLREIVSTVGNLKWKGTYSFAYEEAVRKFFKIDQKQDRVTCSKDSSFQMFQRNPQEFPSSVDETGRTWDIEQSKQTVVSGDFKPKKSGAVPSADKVIVNWERLKEMFFPIMIMRQLVSCNCGREVVGNSCSKTSLPYRFDFLAPHAVKMKYDW